MAEPFEFTRQGRSPATTFAVLAWCAVVIALWRVGTMNWIVAALGLLAIPALVDLIRNPLARLRLDDETLHWNAGNQEGEVPLTQLRRVRLDTRWDFSVRATLQMVDGKRLRLPQHVTPRSDDLEEALNARGIDTERHHFRVL